MTDSNNNDNLNQPLNQPLNQDLTPPTPPNEPIFAQASPSGGMVASLTPDKLDADVEIKRHGNGLDANNGAQFLGAETEIGSKPTDVLGKGVEYVNAMPDGSAARMNATNDLPGVAALQVGREKPTKKKMPVWIWVALGVLVIGIAGFFVYQNFFNRPQMVVTQPTAQTIVLDYWGLWEQSAILTRVLQNFETANPGISVNYIKQPIVGYLNDLKTAFASDGGPDVFRYHATWVPQLTEGLEPMPSSVMSIDNFRSAYYPIMAEQLIVTNEDEEESIVGLPLMYDGLALLYNKIELQAKNVEVPTTWGEFQTAASRLTETDANDNIVFAGAAMGLADNVDHFSDIVSLLIVHNGGDLTSLNSSEVQDALSYYLSFYSPSGTSNNVQTWDDTFDSSTLAFARGEVAMIFAPSWTIHDVLAINPHLDIGVAAMPQLNALDPVGWSSYWVEGVNSNSERKEAAWRLLSYLSQPEVEQALYAEQTATRDFGEMYPQRSMADLLAQDDYLQPYLTQAGKSVAYYFTDKTFDEGLNDNMIAAMATVINTVKDDTKKADTAAQQLQSLTSRVLKNYGIID